LKNVGIAILDPYYINRNFLAKNQNEKIDYPRRDTNEKKILEEIKRKKSEEKNRINEKKIYLHLKYIPLQELFILHQY